MIDECPILQFLNGLKNNSQNLSQNSVASNYWSRRICPSPTQWWHVHNSTKCVPNQFIFKWLFLKKQNLLTFYLPALNGLGTPPTKIVFRGSKGWEPSITKSLSLKFQGRIWTYEENDITVLGLTPLIADELCATVLFKILDRWVWKQTVNILSRYNKLYEFLKNWTQNGSLFIFSLTIISKLFLENLHL